MKENLATFLARMRAVFPEQAVHELHAFYIVMKAEFRSKKRMELDENGEPVRYFEHLRAVTIILVEEAGCRDLKRVKIALGHDTIEDTRLTVAFIEANYGTEVARGISILSKAPKDGYLERLQQFGTWEDFEVKGCDRLHNLRKLRHGSVAFRQKQIAETERDYYPLFDRMVDECPPDERDNMERLRRLVHAEVRNQRALLAA